LERAPGERWQIQVVERRRLTGAIQLLDARGTGLVDLAASTTAELQHVDAWPPSRRPEGGQRLDADQVEAVVRALVELRPNLRLGLVPLDAGGRRHGRGQGVELACWRCPNRPGSKLRDLYRDADQALAEGRRVIYR
jgi:hypothetical protein